MNNKNQKKLRGGFVLVFMVFFIILISSIGSSFCLVSSGCETIGGCEYCLETSSSELCDFFCPDPSFLGETRISSPMEDGEYKGYIFGTDIGGSGYSRYPIGGGLIKQVTPCLEWVKNPPCNDECLGKGGTQEACCPPICMLYGEPTWECITKAEMMEWYNPDWDHRWSHGWGCPTLPDPNCVPEAGKICPAEYRGYISAGSGNPPPCKIVPRNNDFSCGDGNCDENELSYKPSGQEIPEGKKVCVEDCGFGELVEIQDFPGLSPQELHQKIMQCYKELIAGKYDVILDCSSVEEWLNKVCVPIMGSPGPRLEGFEFVNCRDYTDTFTYTDGETEKFVYPLTDYKGLPILFDDISDITTCAKLTISNKPNLKSDSLKSEGITFGRILFEDKNSIVRPVWPQLNDEDRAKLPIFKDFKYSVSIGSGKKEGKVSVCQGRGAISHIVGEVQEECPGVTGEYDCGEDAGARLQCETYNQDPYTSCNWEKIIGTCRCSCSRPQTIQEVAKQYRVLEEEIRVLNTPEKILELNQDKDIDLDSLKLKDIVGVPNYLVCSKKIEDIQNVEKSACKDFKPTNDDGFLEMFRLFAEGREVMCSIYSRESGNNIEPVMYSILSPVKEIMDKVDSVFNLLSSLKEVYVIIKEENGKLSSLVYQFDKPSEGGEQALQSYLTINLDRGTNRGAEYAQKEKDYRSCNGNCQEGSCAISSGKPIDTASSSPIGVYYYKIPCSGALAAVGLPGLRWSDSDLKLVFEELNINPAEDDMTTGEILAKIGVYIKNGKLTPEAAYGFLEAVGALNPEKRDELYLPLINSLRTIQLDKMALQNQHDALTFNLGEYVIGTEGEEGDLFARMGSSIYENIPKIYETTKPYNIADTIYGYFSGESTYEKDKKLLVLLQKYQLEIAKVTLQIMETGRQLNQLLKDDGTKWDKFENPLLNFEKWQLDYAEGLKDADGNFIAGDCKDSDKLEKCETLREGGILGQFREFETDETKCVCTIPLNIKLKKMAQLVTELENLKVKGAGEGVLATVKWKSAAIEKRKDMIEETFDYFIQPTITDNLKQLNELVLLKSKGELKNPELELFIPYPTSGGGMGSTTYHYEGEIGSSSQFFKIILNTYSLLSWDGVYAARGIYPEFAKKLPAKIIFEEGKKVGKIEYNQDEWSFVIERKDTSGNLYTVTLTEDDMPFIMKAAAKLDGPTTEFLFLSDLVVDVDSEQYIELKSKIAHAGIYMGSEKILGTGVLTSDEINKANLGYEGVQGLLTAELRYAFWAADGLQKEYGWSTAEEIAKFFDIFDVLAFAPSLAEKSVSFLRYAKLVGGGKLVPKLSEIEKVCSECSKVVYEMAGYSNDGRKIALSVKVGEDGKPFMTLCTAEAPDLLNLETLEIVTGNLDPTLCRKLENPFPVGKVPRNLVEKVIISDNALKVYGPKVSGIMGELQKMGIGITFGDVSHIPAGLQQYLGITKDAVEIARGAVRGSEEISLTKVYFMSDMDWRSKGTLGFTLPIDSQNTYLAKQFEVHISPLGMALGDPESFTGTIFHEVFHVYAIRHIPEVSPAKSAWEVLMSRIATLEEASGGVSTRLTDLLPNINLGAMNYGGTISSATESFISSEVFIGSLPETFHIPSRAVFMRSLSYEFYADVMTKYATEPDKYELFLERAIAYEKANFKDVVRIKFGSKTKEFDTAWEAIDYILRNPDEGIFTKTIAKDDLKHIEKLQRELAKKAESEKQLIQELIKNTDDPGKKALLKEFSERQRKIKVLVYWDEFDKMAVTPVLLGEGNPTKFLDYIKREASALRSMGKSGPMNEADIGPLLDLRGGLLGEMYPEFSFKSWLEKDYYVYRSSIPKAADDMVGFTTKLKELYPNYNYAYLGTEGFGMARTHLLLHAEDADKIKVLLLADEKMPETIRVLNEFMGDSLIIRFLEKRDIAGFKTRFQYLFNYKMGVVDKAGDVVEEVGEGFDEVFAKEMNELWTYVNGEIGDAPLVLSGSGNPSKGNGQFSTLLEALIKNKKGKEFPVVNFDVYTTFVDSAGYTSKTDYVSGFEAFGKAVKLGSDSTIGSPLLVANYPEEILADYYAQLFVGNVLY